MATILFLIQEIKEKRATVLRFQNITMGYNEETLSMKKQQLSE